ncbi:MAG: DNA repair protein RadA [Oribacterium sp.]|nr:DNA repair protein RadA [Oribacterium sp.]MBO6309460.1 DNA repair protein RadA [Oribacterium sp.]MBP3804650.1 DNA repair protein RadA [Oribacterium sp.]MCR5007512.1 DNA repair protein RadA [Oribacterium sp.]
MAKATSKYFCKECGYESAKWLGQCPGCRAWNSFVEEPIVPLGFSKSTGKSSGGIRPIRQKPVRIDEISLQKEDRIPTGFRELDRVLGGGIVVGSLVLLGGDPGIGKSTLLLEVSRNLSAESKKKALYISGEESLKQIKMRAERIVDISGDLKFMTETNIENIVATVQEEQPDFVVIDSIQTMYTETVTAAPGSVSQVRESSAQLLRLAKENGIAIFIVGHVTKDGNVAGPKILEHMVDVVLYFEGESSGSLRIMHGQKNRFGSTNEIAVFEMEGSGLHEVLNPSELLLSGRPIGASGSVVSCGMEGTRPLLIEIQGLVVQTAFNLPRRTTNGFDYNRLNMLIAIIERRLNLEIGKYDAYLNITGGLHIAEPSMDLAIIMSLISSYMNIEISDDIMIFGEVGLSGEVRAVSNAEQRVEEAVRLGFNKVVLPAYHAKKLNDRNLKDVQLIPVRNIREALQIMKK